MYFPLTLFDTQHFGKHDDWFGKIDFNFQEYQGFTTFPLTAQLRASLITDIIPLKSYDVRKATAVCCILAPTGGDSSNSLHSPLWLRGAVTLPASDWSVLSQLSPLIGRYADWSALFSGQAPAPVRKLTENHNCECQVTRRRREGRTGLHSIRANFDSKFC